jgi:hypothetical protein
MSYKNSRGRNSTQPVVHALIASVVALGSAGGKGSLSRATHILSDIANDPRTGADTSEILQDIVTTVLAME